MSTWKNKFDFFWPFIDIWIEVKLHFWISGQSWTWNPNLESYQIAMALTWPLHQSRTLLKYYVFICLKCINYNDIKMHIQETHICLYDVSYWGTWILLQFYFPFINSHQKSFFLISMTVKEEFYFKIHPFILFSIPRGFSCKKFQCFVFVFYHSHQSLLPNVFISRKVKAEFFFKKYFYIFFFDFKRIQ